MSRLKWGALAAFAIIVGLPLISLDQDFRQFEPEGLTLQLLQADGHPEDHDAALGCCEAGPAKAGSEKLS